jgi:2-polyprenyl-3-methyl-5-hydroxy-6-metoxy-1,4-benzoquinol methylase
MSAKKPCPICGQETLSPTEHQFQVADILHKWESGTKFRFRSDVWNRYGELVTTLNHCSNCDFSIYAPTVVGNGEFYADITSTKHNYYNQNKWEFRQAINDIRKDASLRILDVGCGNGYFLDSLHVALPDVETYGYEISTDLAQEARNKGLPIYTGVFPEHLLADGKSQFFDMICIFQVLEHVENPMQVLSDAKKLLSPDGKIIIAVPDIDGPVGKYFRFMYMNMPPHHVSFWNQSVLQHAAEQIGMIVESVRFEPLADYLYPSYLAPILKGFLPFQWWKTLVHKLRIPKIIQIILKTFKVRELYGIQGHSVYVVLKKRM